ncbi:MAG: acetylglutamate kinase [Erysipelotrichaceae bacterium]|nr:acetylglutamate kinase [Erysipelotrichaceae bacterium]
MDNVTNSMRAHVLVQALPYLQRYYGKTIVVKYGGNAMTSEDLKEQVMEDIVLLSMVGIRVVLVHGGGPELSGLMQRLGKKPEFIDGLRVTDKETIDMAQMVLAGKINKSLVNLLQMKGGQAIGLSGMDGRLIEAKIRDPKYGYVGDVTKINGDVVTTLLDSGYIPVISTLGCDTEGNTYNINGDTGAGKIASAIGAERLIMMTDIEGIMRNREDPDSLISSLTIEEAEQLTQEGVISGGMIPKVRCCTDALNEGVKAAVIIDGRVPHAVLMEILTDEGAGTLFTKE